MSQNKKIRIFILSFIFIIYYFFFSFMILFTRVISVRICAIHWHADEKLVSIKFN